MSSDYFEWAKYNDDVMIIDDIPWHVRNKMLMPIPLPHEIKNVNPQKVKLALKKTKALLAHWTTQWDREESEWWWTCCDKKDYDIESIKHQSGRRGILKGLSNCEVKRISPEDFAHLTYKIFYNSLKSYGYKKIPSYEEYYNDIIYKSQFKGFELWGAFTKGRIAAYAACIVLKDAVSLGSTKSDRELNYLYPNNALFFHITKHYLRDRGMKYVTNGYRTLLHPTSINDFLIRLGYRKIFGKLNVELSSAAKLIASIKFVKSLSNIDFIKNKFPLQTAQINGFLKLLEINHSFSTQ